VLAAFGAPGVLDREFALPEISPQRRIPAGQAIGFHLVDYVVHGWDVARALGVAYELEHGLLTVALDIARQAPGGESRLRPGAPFGPRVPFAGGGLLDQIVALLGRRPSWPALSARPPAARPAGLPWSVSAERADVVIIGAGLAGSATAWALARRGRSAVVLEAFAAGHRRGSSHGSARIFRRAYPDPLYVRLTGQAQQLWRQLAAETGVELIATTGGLDFGPAREQEKIHEILAAAKVPAELMPAAAAAERWPDTVFGTAPVLFQPDAGVIDADRAMTVMRARAEAGGAQIHYGSPVLDVSASGAGAVVHTAERSWQAPVVVVAAGSWLPPLLGGHVPLPPLAVTQQEAFHFAPRDGAAPGAPAASRPVFLYHGEAVLYGLLAGRDGEVPGAVKIGDHSPGPVTTAEGRDGAVRPAGRQKVRAFVRDTFHDLDPDPVGELTCLYTSTATEDFVLDRYGPFVVCSACSGHGAKFAPLTGELAADLACGGPAGDPRFTLAAHRG
jgi:monomeric sarcosine oxidase